MLLKIYPAGSPILRQVARPLSDSEIKAPETQQLIDLMIATLRDKGGVGLAAPQVGEPYRILIIEDKKSYHKNLKPQILSEQGRKPVSLKVLINPSITYTDDLEAAFFEGCLSVEGYRAVVSRRTKATVSGKNRHGEPIRFTARGWLARIVQHEIDHLNGKLYIDTMVTTTFMTLDHFGSNWKNASADKIRSMI